MVVAATTYLGTFRMRVMESQYGLTYCMTVRADDRSVLKRGAAVVTPTSASCKKVLYLLIVVGRTSADGSEKSQ